MIKRSLKSFLIHDLGEKIVLLSGPRQCGKTTLSKQLFKKFDYLNFDSASDRGVISSGTWNRKTQLVIFDELHKMKNWKSWIKGVYDTEGNRPRLLVTGSARMNQLRKVGDSLAGRHLHYHLHPFDLKELNFKDVKSREDALNTLLRTGGFPEPFLKGTQAAYNRWSASHLDVILRQDLLDLENTYDIKNLELLIHLLAHKVGSKLSYVSLARKLQKDPKTIARWLTILENLYVIFRLTPYYHNITQSLLKSSKYYFYDTGFVQGPPALRLENLTACALLKETQKLFDAKGVKSRMHFIQTKTGKEIDFVILMDNRSPWLIEVKWGDNDFSPHFKYFAPYFKKARCVQVVKNCTRTKTTAQGYLLDQASRWLAEFKLF